MGHYRKYFLQPKIHQFKTIFLIIVALNSLNNSSYAEDIPKDSTTDSLRYCVAPKVQYGQYSSYDGGKSALYLMQNECYEQYKNVIDECVSKGTDRPHCQLVAGMLTQLIIKQMGK